MKISSNIAALAMLLALFFNGPTASAETGLQVAVAASLRDVFPALKTVFEKENRGVTLSPVYGASGVFSSQILQGAPFDVFLTADAKYSDLLVAEGKASRKDTHVFAKGRLAFWVSNSVGLDVKRLGLGVLKSPKINRLVMANPATAPYGRAAQEVLQKTGHGNFCRDRCLLAQDAGQAALLLDNGSVDAGFVPLSLARAGVFGKSGKWVEISDRLHSPLPNTAVVVFHPKADNRPDPSFARLFVKWLTGKKAQALLHQAGY